MLFNLSVFALHNSCCCCDLPNDFSLFVPTGGGFPKKVGPLLWFNGWKQRWSLSEIVVSLETCLFVCQFFCIYLFLFACQIRHLLAFLFFPQWLPATGEQRQEGQRNGYLRLDSAQQKAERKWPSGRVLLLKSYFKNEMSSYTCTNIRCLTTIIIFSVIFKLSDLCLPTLLSLSGNPTADER